MLLSVCAHGQGTAPALPDAPVAKPVPIDIDTPADKRVLGVLPNYRTSNPVSVYQPITAKQKLIIGAKDSFDYPLLSDPDGAVATQFGVRRRFTKLSPTKRATFVIGSDLRVIDVIQSEVRMNVHADRALEAVKAASTT